MDRSDISVVVPVFNEAGNIPELYKRLKKTLTGLDLTHEIVFVDDGSSDASAAALALVYQADKKCARVIHLSRNFGHQLALTAGLDYAKGRCVVVMDADLQDPPEVIADFVAKWREGYAVVYGVRSSRAGEAWLKLWTAGIFYKMIRRITAMDIPENVGDFYLLDRKVVDVFVGLRERHRFIRGMVAWLGFKRTGVTYARKARHSGTTKYPFWKMVRFSFDAVTSFSFAPLKMVSFLGAVFATGAFGMILWTFYQKLFTTTTVTGWSSLMAAILFIGGVQLLSLGVIGEYIARIGDDVKARPLYAVDQILE
ncbi:MAG: glycosyltransferase family 2 protein [Candidatus Omnitrophica bacterium]|nr:glycosyltransferase family 2 protein [Candidatus Omnitrophota bacterium]